MATDLAARIGGRKALYGNLTWTRPGLVEEEKARSHQAAIGFGKGHRLASQKASWDRAPMRCDSEASSSNDEDMDTVQPEDISDVFSSPRTPSKPRFMRNRFGAGTPHTPSGTLMERLGVVLPPEDGVASVVPKSVPTPRTNSAASCSIEKPAVSNNVDKGTRPAAVASSGHSSGLEISLLPAPSFELLDNAKPGQRPEESIPGLNISRARFESDVDQNRVEPVAKAPNLLDSGSSPELVDTMRRLLVPLIVKQAGREGSNSNNCEVHDLDLAQKARSVITDDICEEFIRQAIASSSALNTLRKRDAPQSRIQDIEMSPPTTVSTSVPPGLGEATESVRSVVATAAPRPTVSSRVEAPADSGKTVLPSHPLPTGPRLMQNENRAPSNLHDGREVLGVSRSSFAYSAKGKEREWDLDRTSASRDRFHLPPRQSPHSRRSQSPRPVSGYRRSRSRSGSLSRPGHRPSPPGWYRHDIRRPHDDHREFGYRSPSPSAARNGGRYIARRPERQPSSMPLYYDHADRRPTRRSPSPRDRREVMSARHFSSSYDDRERSPVQRPSHSYDGHERLLARQIPPPYDNRETTVQQAPLPYDDRNRGLSPYVSRYHSRYIGTSSPRHSISSSRGHVQARSPSRGRSPPPPHPQPTSQDRVPKRKSYSPLARGGPPRGWSREPPPRASPDSPFPKKSKHERDHSHQRLSYERPAVSSPTRTRREFGRDAGLSPNKYQHICHRPPGYRCDHASHYDDSTRTQPLARPEALWDSSRYDGVAPAPRSATDSDFKNWNRSDGDSYAHAKRRDSASPPAHMPLAPSSSREDAPMTPTLPDLASSIATLHYTIDASHSQPERLGGLLERTTSLIPTLGMAPVTKVERNEEGLNRDPIDGFKPPGLVTPVPALSAAPTVLDIPSDSISLGLSSSKTLVNHTVTPPGQSSGSLHGHLKGQDEDTKPDIKKLEEILANMKREQQRLPLPDAPPPQYTQPVAPFPPSLLPSVVPVAGLIPTLTVLPPLMNTGSSTPSSHHSTESSQIPTPPSVPGPAYTPVPAKVEEVEAAWPVGGMQQMQGYTGSPITQTWSLPSVAPSRDQTTAIPHRQQVTTMTGTRPSFAAVPFPVAVYPEPLSNVTAGKTEAGSTSVPEQSFLLGSSLGVPGIWLVQQGADSVKTVDRSFHIGGEFAREWGIPAQSDSDDPAPGMENGDAALTMKPGVTLQLLCFATEKLSLVDWKGNPETILELQQRWPMIQDLIIVSNHDTPGQRVWMSHDLPKPNGTGRPILLERYIHSGPNTLRIIQLTDLSKFTFVLFAKPDVPLPEAREKSESSTADKYDDYFAKLREGLLAKPQGQGQAPSSKPGAGSVTIQVISSDEEL